MILVSYDFTNDKERTKFAKFLKKFGRKVQYSVYEIKNSSRVLQNIITEIEFYSKRFQKTDSVILIFLCEACDKKVKRYGYAKNEESDVIVFD